MVVARALEQPQPKVPLQQAGSSIPAIDDGEFAHLAISVVKNVASHRYTMLHPMSGPRGENANGDTFGQCQSRRSVPADPLPPPSMIGRRGEAFLGHRTARYRRFEGLLAAFRGHCHPASQSDYRPSLPRRSAEAVCSGRCDHRGFRSGLGVERRIESSRRKRAADLL